MKYMIDRAIATLHEAVTQKSIAPKTCPACSYGSHCDPAYNHEECICPCHSHKPKVL